MGVHPVSCDRVRRVLRATQRDRSPTPLLTPEDKEGEVSDSYDDEAPVVHRSGAHVHFLRNYCTVVVGHRKRLQDFS